MSQVTAILVHGAWANAACWSKVISALDARGLRSIAVSMPLTSLEEDAAVVRRAIALAEGPVVLVGHSYGGAVATVAGNESKVTGLVYVAAFAPDSGESAGGLNASVEPTSLAAEIRPDAEGFLKLTREGIDSSFGQDLTDSEKLIAYATQGPTAAKALGDAVSTPAWKTKPSWYIVAEHDHAIQPALQSKMAERAGSTRSSVASSHLVMLSHPDAVSDVIVAAAS
ncbi:alpha/beta fold hydrolase [Paraburkholderia sp. DHOC27]|uniref:alpha/beta fold hydrolase n=1 Tax=Paraburkholderia sp. DHOC27 TaxID=2303330 RepID=UPI000E3C3BDF|nr:alpha/beta hydrolase [Paraburkholderia sp. DHOC27]RFU46946.1 alpha/beta hydrolase [Paraburkholderia sp. DHOC27]